MKIMVDVAKDSNQLEEHRNFVQIARQKSEQGVYEKMNNPTNKEKEKALKDKLHLELTMLDANLQQSIKNITTLLNEIDLVTA